MPEEDYIEKARAADFRKNIKRIADSLERIAKFTDWLQGLVRQGIDEKLEIEKKKKKKVKKHG